MQQFAGMVKWLALAAMVTILAGCAEEETIDKQPFILLKSGEGFVSDGDYIPVGGKMIFGVSAVGGDAVITNLRVKRITASGTVTELDKGMFVDVGGLDTSLVYTKGGEEAETWVFFIQNSRRDTARTVVTIYKGEGSAYGPIFHYPSITLGFSQNSAYPHFLSLLSGMAFDEGSVAGHEAEVDLAAFWYLTSGKSSPTLSCPGYPSAQSYYPLFETWPVKNATVYDYKSVDNDLISLEEFNSALNDSLLVLAFNPQNVSGLCKFCYTGKIVPFKTASGKYGLIRVIRADEEDTGTVELEVKIQQ